MQIEDNILNRDLPWELAHALHVIRDSYGDVAYYKPKALAKFGRNPDLGATAETVQEHGGIETYLPDNLIDVVVSSDAGDTQEVAIEGQTISGGLLTFVRQTATLNGTTNVTLDTPLCRATRIQNLGTTDFAGTVKVVDATAPSVIYVQASGVQANGRIYNRSQKCSTSISSNDYYVINKVIGTVLKKQAASVDFALMAGPVGGVMQELYAWSGVNIAPGRPHSLDVPIIIPSNYDVRIDAVASTTGVEAVARFSGYLALVDRNDG